jgi:quinol monooxygenase YgiN
MSEVIGIVDIRAAEGHADEVVAAFEACIAKTHEEEGCLTYALHRDAADPNHFVHLERWRSQADLDAHMTQPYVAELFAVAGRPGVLAAPPQLTFAGSLALGDPKKGSLS